MNFWIISVGSTARFCEDVLDGNSSLGVNLIICNSKGDYNNLPDELAPDFEIIKLDISEPLPN